MREHIINYLCCPDCNTGLLLKKEQISDTNNHIIKGELKCSKCKLVYPIIDGVPCFSLTITNSKIDLNRKNFADEWNYFTSNLNKKRQKIAKGELDSYFHDFVSYNDLDNKIVLDAGCGGGRFTYVVSKESRAKEIIGVDLSSAVFTAFKNTEQLDNVTIIQADITKLPFQNKKIFDFIYSVGVLHHMPKPIDGFNALVKLLKEDGKILTWVYGKEGNFLYLTFADPFRRVTSRLPFRINLYLSFLISLMVWLIIWLIYFPVNILTGQKISNKILPLNEYLNYFRKRGFKDFWRTVFDKMVPTISHYISENEFKNWFELNNLDHKIYFRNGHSWIGIGKPEKTKVLTKTMYK